MTIARLVSAALTVGALACTGALRAGEKGSEEGTGEPLRLQVLDVTEGAPGGKPHAVAAVPGVVVQVSIYFRTWPEENLRSLRIDVKGKSAVQVGAAQEVTVWSDPRKEKIDRGKRHFCVFFVADKPGDTLIRIIPVGVDGKERPVREVALHVFTSRQPGEQGGFRK